MKLEPVELRGRHVRLVPMSEEHVPALWEAGGDPEVWRWTQSHPRSESDMREYVRTALRWRAQGTALPFVTTEAATGRVIGSSRLANVAPEHRRAEIGWTWISPAWQRSAVNTEAKLLMLTHAFESLGCIRVELKTDALNERSRRAIARIGAREEGTLRRHSITDEGRIRDTVYFSIVDHEWPAAKERLMEMLSAHRS